MFFDVRHGIYNRFMQIAYRWIHCSAIYYWTVSLISLVRFFRVNQTIIIPLLAWIPRPKHLLILPCRPTERSREDVDVILARLQNLKAFERFHPSVLQQICMRGFYEYLERGITCRCSLVELSCYVCAGFEWVTLSPSNYFCLFIKKKNTL
jgi:hypothetical protein